MHCSCMFIRWTLTWDWESIYHRWWTIASFFCEVIDEASYNNDLQKARWHQRSHGLLQCWQPCTDSNCPYRLSFHVISKSSKFSPARKARTQSWIWLVLILCLRHHILHRYLLEVHNSENACSFRLNSWRATRHTPTLYVFSLGLQDPRGTPRTLASGSVGISWMSFTAHTCKHNASLSALYPTWFGLEQSHIISCHIRTIRAW